MAVLAPHMFGSKVPRAWKAPLMVEVQARLPLFDDLSDDTIGHLTAAGLGRGFLTAPACERPGSGISAISPNRLRTPSSGYGNSGRPASRS
jgi:hypothetical protein